MTNRQIFMEARRISPDAFYELSVAKYGVEGSQSLTREQIKALAIANEVLVPVYIANQKTARGKYSTRPPGYIDQEPAKAEPKKAEPVAKAPVVDEKKIMSAANSFRDYIKMTRKMKNVWGEDPIEPDRYSKNGGVTFAFRGYGDWVRDEGDDDEDSDFLVPTQETLAACRAIANEWAGIIPDMKFSFRYSEKEWMYFFVEPK